MKMIEIIKQAKTNKLPLPDWELLNKFFEYKPFTGELIWKVNRSNIKKGSFDKTVQVTFDDKRKLKCGTFIRQFSIDEVPQLINVLLGDMSIVGPRPHMVEHDIKYSKLFQSFLKRHKCSPGLTGWAQVNGLRGATPNPDNMKRRMEHDLWYLNNWTIWLDIYIVLKTFYALFKYKGE